MRQAYHVVWDISRLREQAYHGKAGTCLLLSIRLPAANEKRRAVHACLGLFKHFEELFLGAEAYGFVDDLAVLHNEDGWDALDAVFDCQVC